MAGQTGRAGRVGAAARSAFRFILIIGLVNLFADFTYEGGRSIMGPFLGLLGATGTIVGFVAGFGELMGYALRSVSGYLADKTGRYWTITWVGYAVNMLAVPALALAGNWPLAAALIVLERTGRAIRRPAVETMLSQASKDTARGWVFGFNEALDQTGATIGPLVVALVIGLRGGYRRGFAILLLPALLCLAAVVLGRVLYPRPQELEKRVAQPLAAKGFSKSYWLIFAVGGLLAAGFADFSLVAFHFRRGGIMTEHWIPVLYAVAMATGAISALVFGRLYDRIGLRAVMIPFLLGAFFAPFVFLGTLGLALTGMVLWGISAGAQDSLLKAVLAGIIPAGRRSTGFGVFDTGFGIAWFLGSAVMGLLYDRSILALVIFSIVLEIAALPVLVLLMKRKERAEA